MGDYDDISEISDQGAIKGNYREDSRGARNPRKVLRSRLSSGRFKRIKKKPITLAGGKHGVDSPSST